MGSLLPVAREGRFSTELLAFSKMSLFLSQGISFQFFLSTGTCLSQTPHLPLRNPVGIPRSPITCQNMIGEARKENKEEKNEKEMKTENEKRKNKREKKAKRKTEK